MHSTRSYIVLSTAQSGETNWLWPIYSDIPGDPSSEPEIASKHSRNSPSFYWLHDYFRNYVDSFIVPSACRTNNCSILESRNCQTNFKEVDYYHCSSFRWSNRFPSLRAPFTNWKNIFLFPSSPGHDGMSSSDQLAFKPHTSLPAYHDIIAAGDISGEFSIRGIFDNRFAKKRQWVTGFDGPSPFIVPESFDIQIIFPLQLSGVAKALNLMIQRLAWSVDRRISS